MGIILVMVIVNSGHGGGGYCSDGGVSFGDSASNYGGNVMAIIVMVLEVTVVRS